MELHEKREWKCAAPITPSPRRGGFDDEPLATSNANLLSLVLFVVLGRDTVFPGSPGVPQVDDGYCGIDWTPAHASWARSVSLINESIISSLQRRCSQES